MIQKGFLPDCGEETFRKGDVRIVQAAADARKNEKIKKRKNVNTGL